MRSLQNWPGDTWVDVPLEGRGWINGSGSLGYSIHLKNRGYILGVINPHKSILTFDPNPPGTCFLPGDIFMVWQV